MAFQHGINLTEVSTGTRSLVAAATAVIGMVVTAPAAKAEAFPLNKAVLVTDPEAALGNAGATGTLPNALRAIADQVRCPIVIVRVAEGANAGELGANVIGTTNAQGIKAGMQALLAAEAQLGVKPRILGCPGLDTQAVTTALVVVAKKLRAMVYAAAIGSDISAAKGYRANFTARELMLVYPDFYATDATSGAPVVSYGVARALGLRARIDLEQGFHKTISNVAVDGVIGLTKDIQFDIQDSGCEANLLNESQVCALVRAGGGFRIWGSRTCSGEPLFAFESAARTAQVLLDTIGNGMMWAIDKPLRPSLAKDIVETINGELRQMTLAGQILGGKAWFDATRNPTDQLKAGKLTIDYDYTPVPPLEALGLNQRITDSYFADFAAAVAA
ncbi:phage tail sheath subtilisin-like domain-containing protein [Sphingomonas sp. R1]|uniref:phage tail sheath subtilisin-like domain-containing protein n=1 Tax=Sphingomonas sp. R1 TaxID=399176 RepID=UPI00222459A8|nr:phage tail sheath subtilisin-like domain-containing protein [Sphingomonas sp. R1]UYY78414.1 phage tail sheath subtilisin-like domain-containing protein [Sphingomonas sp. R1]